MCKVTPIPPRGSFRAIAGQFLGAHMAQRLAKHAVRPYAALC